MSKLYTEEQVRIMLGKARLLNMDDTEMFTDDYLIEQQTPIQLPSDKTTGFEVIDGLGRRLVEYGVNIEISMQDDGRTMKVFLTKIKGGQGE